MAWIEFHPTRIKRLQKFAMFRERLGLSENEALGALGGFWGEVMDLSESGDITGWSAAYVTERLGLDKDPESVLGAMLDCGWIDVKSGRMLVHDWLDTAGRYLTVKYASKRKSRLEEIWSVHGLTYGTNQLPTKNQPTTNQKASEAQERKGEEGKGKDPIPTPSALDFDPKDLPPVPRRPQAHPILLALREKMGAHYDWLSSRTRATEPAQEAVIIAEVERMAGVHGKEAVINELVALGGATVSVSYTQANRNLVERRKKNPPIVSKADETDDFYNSLPRLYE